MVEIINTVVSTVSAFKWFGMFANTEVKPTPVIPTVPDSMSSIWNLIVSFTVKDVSLVLITVSIMCALHRICKCMRRYKPTFRDARAQTVNPSPTVYNNTMNIQIWLSEMQENI